MISCFSILLSWSVVLLHPNVPTVVVGLVVGQELFYAHCCHFRTPRARLEEKHGDKSLDEEPIEGR